MLAVRYDLERVKRAVTKDALRSRPPGMYRFRELTPLADGETPVTLGEGGTPLLPLPRLAAHLGLRHLWGKDEGQNPTGSFKARGLGMAITEARTLGARGFIIPSAGNAGGAAALYARALRVCRARSSCRAARRRRPSPRRAIGGAHVFTIEGSIATAGKVVGRVAPELGWFDLSTLKEPYRLEGKKTMGLELAEQLDWTMPDVLLYPDRRRHRAGRHSQGLRRAARDGLGHRRAAALLRRAGRGLRADGHGLARRRGEHDAVGEPDDRTPPGCACRHRSPAARCCASCARPGGRGRGERAGDRSTPSICSRAWRESGPRPRVPRSLPRWVNSRTRAR